MISISKCSIKDEQTLEQLNKIFKTGWFINGPYIKKFARLWADYTEKEYCIPVSSGSSALTITLRALKEYSNATKVIVPTFSFAATVFSVIEANLEPVFCAVDKNMLLDQDNCLKILENEKDILAVIPVHIYGQKLVLRPSIFKSAPFILEDACQAHGIKPEGNAAAFSFYPSKNLGTCGNAGAIVTNIEMIYEWTSRYINYGDSEGEKYRHKMPSSNQRMDELEACVLVNKLESFDLDMEIITRNEQAAIYSNLGVIPFINSRVNTWHIYPILVEDPDDLVVIFKENGIQAGRHYPYTLFDLAPGDISYLRYAEEDYSYQCYLQISLPIGSHLKDKNIEKVVKVLKGHYQYAGNNIWRKRVKK